MSYELLAKYGIKTIPTRIVKNLEEAASAAAELGYPAVVKIAAPGIHKTDIGCVKLNVEKEGMANAFNEVVGNAQLAGVKYDGVIIQKMATTGLEVIVGIKQDPQFGPIILFGMGGIYTEILKDFSIRICQISKTDAYEMIEELKSSEIFSARGREYNKEAIADLLLKVSEIAMNEKISELDLNPIFLYPKGSKEDYVVVDMRVV